MKNQKQILIYGLLLLSLSSCQGQSEKRNILREAKLAHNGFDFTPHLENFSSNEDTDTTNQINIELSYHPDSLNHYGKGRGFMFHKKGIKYWFDFAQKQYKEIGLSGKNYGYAKASKTFRGKDRKLLIDFDKWVFFIDKQYLEKGVQDGELDYNDPNRGKLLADNYVLKENVGEYEIILLEQLAGEKSWYMIDKIRIKTGEYNRCLRWQDKNGNWHEGEEHLEMNFNEEKRKQYAKMK